MSAKNFSLGFILLFTCSFFSSVQAETTTENLHPSCMAYLDLISHPEIIKWAGDEIPEDLRGLNPDQFRAKIIQKGLIGDPSDCTSSLKRRLSFFQKEYPNYSQLISSMLPTSCEKDRATYSKTMEGKLMDIDGSKLAQMVVANDANLLQLHASNPKTTADYCTYSEFLWENADQISAKDFDSANQKFPMPEECAQAYEELKNEVFGEDKKDFGQAYMLGMMKSKGALPMLLAQRAYLFYSYSHQPAVLEKECKANLRL